MAKKKKFHYNPETLSFEEIKVSFKTVSKKFLIQLLSSVFFGIIFFILFIMLVDSPDERILRRDNSELELNYKMLSRQYDELNGILEDLKQRDNNLYRVIFQADSVPEAVRHNSMAMSRSNDLGSTPSIDILNDTRAKADDVEKQLYIQSKSYDELAELIGEHADRLLHVPAIQPVLNRDLRRLASGFGYRIDPVYRTRRMHQGMDFSAPVGTDIFATGAGKVVFAGWKQGYGNTVIIDHGFDYQTVYAHMYKIKVRTGQKVTRAEVIGLVGNSGKSTGPHLHYEVRYKDHAVDPLNYYFLDLSPEEYDEMIRLAQNAGQVMD